MSGRRSIRTVALAAAVVALVGSGCGGDDAPEPRVVDKAPSVADVASSSSAAAPSDDQAPTTVTVPATSSTPGEDAFAGDLDGALLTQEDLSSDWGDAPPEGGPPLSVFTTFLQEGQCARPEEGPFPQPLELGEAQFSGGAGFRTADRITNAVALFAPGDAQTWFDSVVDRIARCDDPTVVANDIVPLQGPGDEAVLLHVAVDLAPGVATARLVVAMARAGDVVAVVLSLTAFVDAVDEEALVRTVVGRL